MKVKRMGITEILRRIWLFSANKIKSSEFFSKQPSQLIIKLNSSLLQKLGTLVPKIKKSVKSVNNMSSDEILCKSIFVYRYGQLAIVQDRHFYKFSHLVILKIKHYKKKFPRSSLKACHLSDEKLTPNLKYLHSKRKANFQYKNEVKSIMKEHSFMNLKTDS